MSEDRGASANGDRPGRKPGPGGRPAPRRGRSGEGRSGEGRSGGHRAPDRRASSGGGSGRGAGGGRRPDRGAGRDRGGETGRGFSRDRGGEAGRGAGRGSQERDESRARDGDGAPSPPKVEEPQIDEDITGNELDAGVRSEFHSLPGAVAKLVARHLVMAGELLDEDPERAHQHAQAARRRAGRIGVVREAAGIAAYRAGHYAEALAELRAARRMTGSAEYLPMMADCERGLGRPLRALDLASDPAVTGLDTAGRVEMLIVAAGARRDLGEHAAAAAMLQVPELRARAGEGWLPRLQYAYADALESAGRVREAHRWFLRAAETDTEAETDAAERAEALAGTA